jgi:hypothetical protein
MAATTRHTPPTKAKATPSKPTAASKPKSAVDRTTELSDELLHSLESGQKAAIEAVRKFIDTVDEALPGHDETPSKRQEVVDSALEMAERLVHTQYEFMRKAVDSAGKSLNRFDDAKPSSSKQHDAK